MKEFLRRHRSKVIFSVFVILLIIIIILSVLLGISQNENNNTSTDEQKTKITGTLTVEDLVNNWEESGDWNITNFIYGKDNIKLLNKSYIQVNYDAGSFESEGGFKFYSQPPYVFPSKSACFSYLVKFPDNFDFVKGGKLPGMWIGNQGANGGVNLDNGFSSRFMWRSGGQAEVYLYVPLNQTTDYQKLIINNNNYGDSLWRGLLNLELDIWNNMTMCIKLNTYDKYDGILKVINNNNTFEFDTLKWTNHKDELINGLMMTTFFGGNDISWAPKYNTMTYFTNFTVWNF
jgi:hypothetical protein